MPSNNSKHKTITGTLDKEWTARFDTVLPPKMTAHAFTTLAVKSMINQLAGGGTVDQDAAELLELRAENLYLKRLIREAYQKAGL